MSREAEEISRPRYQVVMTVRNNPKARMAIAMAKMVSDVLTLRLNAFFMIILGRIILS
jgi:hypothetical protein